MKGYALLAKNKVGWTEMNRPKVGPYDAIIRPTAVSPCTSDVLFVETGIMPHLFGLAMGHEAVGIVDEVGELVEDFKPGDHVAVPSVHPVWRSKEAQNNIANLNDRNHYFSTCWPDKGGVFAEYFHVYDADMNLAMRPDEVTPLQAVMLTDMATTAFSGVDALGINYGDKVVVLGIGPVGLLGVCAAIMKGAGRVIAIGSRPICFEVAKKYGATDCVDYKAGDIVKQVLELTGGEQVDAVFVTGGGSDSINSALAMLRHGGTVSNIVVFGDAVTTINNLTWGFGIDNKTIKTIRARGGRFYMERLLDLVKYGRLKPELMVTHIYRGFEKIEEAFHVMGQKTPDLIKPVVLID